MEKSIQKIKQRLNNNRLEEMQYKILLNKLILINFKLKQIRLE